MSGSTNEELAATAAERNGAGGVDAVAKALVSNAPTTATELLRSDAGNVEAPSVSMERSGAERITGERVSTARAAC